jgi:hemolysin activation/secretion protein
VRVQVVEGFIDAVEERGNPRRWTRLSRGLAGGLTASRPVTVDAIERSLLLLEDLPGLAVRSVLSPSPTQFGAARASLELAHAPVHGYASLDNRGSRFVGPLLSSVGVQLNSLAGWHEQLTLHGATVPDRTRELRYGAATFSMPVSQQLACGRLRVGAEVLRTTPSLPESAFPLGTRSRGEEFSIGYSQALQRTRSRNLRFDLSFSAKNGVTSLEALPQSLFKPTEDRVRVAEIGFAFEGLDRGGAANLASVRWHQGIDIVDASDGRGVSRLTGTDAQFTYFDATLSRVQPCGERLQIFLKLDGQFSLDPLLPAERFGVGGSQTGRGFPPGTLTGDSGVAATVELRHIRRLGPIPFQLYGLLDLGWAWDRNTNNKHSSRLIAGGAGLRFNLGSHVSLNPEVVNRLDGFAADGDESRWRFLFSVVGRF